MADLKILDMNGNETGTFCIEDDLLIKDGYEQAVHEVVVAYLAGLRRGTASTLQKGEVSGSGRKLYRQKGTGLARAHYLRSPIRRGGGIVFGPKPRSYVKKVNKKVARLAFARVLSDKVVNGDITVIEKFDLPELKTKLISDLFKKINLKGKKVCLVVRNISPDMKRVVRNIENINMVDANSLNTYDILSCNRILCDLDGMNVLKDRLYLAKQVTEDEK